MRSFITRKLPPAVLGIGLSMIGAVAIAADDPYPRLPGEPQVQPAVNGKMSDAEAINLVIDWAKFGKDPTAEKFIDTAITAITIGYPPVGIALGVVKGFIMGLAGGPDPVAEALKVMDKRLTALEKNVTDLAKALSQMHNQILNIENRIRLTELLRRREEIATLKGTLAIMHEKTPSPLERYEFTQRVVRLAARFRPDSEADNDMWQWADLHVYTNPDTGKLAAKPFEADFRTLPMMESYLNALVLLMASIQFEGRGTEYVKTTYHDELMRHVQALSVRPYWLEGQDQITLPERLMSRVSCEVNVGQKYPDRDGTCSAGYAMCTDNLARRNKLVGSGISDWHVNTQNTLCMAVTNLATPTMRPADRADLEQKWEARSDRAPWGSDALLRVRQYTGYVVPAEEILEDFHGLETMTVLADRLYKLAVSGTLMEPPVYSFDHTYWDKEYLYGVKKSGELVWFGHLIGEDRNPPKPDNHLLKATKYSTYLKDGAIATTETTTRGLGDMAVSARTTSAATISGAAAGPTGRTLTTTEVQGRAKQIESVVPKAPVYSIVHKWEGPKTVGSGWQSFRDIIPAAVTSVTPNVAAASFYGVTNDGALMWYRHDGFVNGEPRWKGPTKVGTGWQSFKKIVPAGDGVVYGIGADGSLRWYRLNNVGDPGSITAAATSTRVQGTAIAQVRAAGISQSVTAPPNWSGPNVVGSGWGHFVHVFSTGEGVVYAVDPQGKLWWYKHRGYLNGTPDWEGPKQVGNGWAGFKKVFSPSEGYIYALTQDGQLLWYQHQGYMDGTVKWRGPTAVGSAWGDYAFVFSAMQGTPQAPVVR